MDNEEIKLRILKAVGELTALAKRQSHVAGTNRTRRIPEAASGIPLATRHRKHGGAKNRNGDRRINVAKRACRLPNAEAREVA